MSNFWAKNKWPLLVALLAFLVRLIYLIELSSRPGFTAPIIDELWHWEWAQQIISGSFWGEEAFFRAPLYPYFLAMLAKITGSSIFWTKFLQTILCGGTAVLLFKLTEHIFNRPVAIIAGFFYAFYGTLVFYETMFLIPVLFLFLTVWAMYRLVVYCDSPSWRTWIFTGLLFGLAAVARPNVLAVIPFLMVWLFWRRSAPEKTLPRWHSPALLLAGVIIAIAPVTIRNLAVTGKFTLISSQGGINLYLGNNPAASGLSMVMPEIELNESISWKYFVSTTTAIAETEVGHPMNDGEVSAYWTGKAVDFITSNPGKFMTLLWKKTVYLLIGFENSDNIDIYYQRTKSLLFSVLLWRNILAFPFGVLLPLALVGAYLSRNRFKELLPIYIFLIAYVPTIILFLVTARHRLPLVPFLIILAAFGTHALVKGLKKRATKVKVIALLILVLSLLLFNRTYYHAGGTNEFQTHYNEGLKYFRLNDYIRAEQEYLAADQVNPYSATLLTNLGYVQFLIGKYTQAQASYDRAIGLAPRYPRAYNNLGLILQKRGQLDSAIVLFEKSISLFDSTVAGMEDLVLYQMNLGDALEKSGQSDSAAIAFERAVSMAGADAKVYFRAAAFFARHDQYDKSDSLFSRATGMDQPSASDYFNWGLSHLERQNFQSGVNLMMRALRQNPKLYQAHYCIAAAYLDSEEPREIVNAYLDTCLSMNPAYEPALRLRRAINADQP